MKFAFADPPYFGLAEKFYGHLHPEAAEYDRLEKHAELIERLCGEFSDGWAYCLQSPALKHILPLMPDDVRIMAWVKPFASFKPGVGVAYAWEPVIVRGGRKRTRKQPTVRDWVDVNITLRKGLTGAKPRGFCCWILELLNVQPGDELVDIFPGTGIMGECFEDFVVRNEDRQLTLLG